MLGRKAADGSSPFLLTGKAHDEAPDGLSCAEPAIASAKPSANARAASPSPRCIRPWCVRRSALAGPTPKSGERRSLRKIATELAKIGETLAATGLPSAKEAARAYFARNGQPYSAKSVRAMLAQRLPREVMRSVSR